MERIPEEQKKSTYTNCELKKEKEETQEKKGADRQGALFHSNTN